MNDRELKAKLRSYLQRIVRDLRMQAQTSRRWSDGIKLAFGGAGLGTIATGVAAVVTGGLAPAAILLLAIGTSAGVASVGGSSYFSARADRCQGFVQDIEQLVALLK